MDWKPLYDWFSEIEEYAYSDDYGEEYNYDDYEYYIDEDTPAQGEKNGEWVPFWIMVHQE